MKRESMTRQELYDLVWSTPMRHAAKTFGMSDVGLKKHCRSKAVPVPPRGYWNKLYAGHRVKKTPLPDLPPRPTTPLPTTTRSGSQKPSPKGPAQASRPEPSKQHVRATSNLKRSKPRESPKRGRWPVLTHFIVPIGKWEWGYGFGINKTKKLIPGYFSDSRGLSVQGRLLRPMPLAGAPMRLLFHPTDVNPERYVEVPTAIGPMWSDRETKGYQGFVPLPRDVLSSLLTMLVADKLRYVVFDAAPLFRGQTQIESYRFDDIVDFEEYP
jgi:hypothetical protein